MKLSAAGWKHDRGWNRIAEVEVSRDVMVESAPTRWAEGQIYLYKDSEGGGIALDFHAADLKLNGNFLCSLKFSSIEIAVIFQHCFGQHPISNVVELLVQSVRKPEGPKVERNLFLSINELPLKVKAKRALVRAGIVYVGDLIQKSYQDILRFPNTSGVELSEISRALDEMGLTLGTNIPGWSDVAKNLKYPEISEEA